MKRKGLLILGLTAALTAGSGITALAAAGWATENGQWVYYDNFGSHVTNEWKRGADNQWRYLNSRGQMAVDSWVDEEYYVDSNGVMVAGKWMKLNSNIRSLTANDHWYYFQDSGKVVTITLMRTALWRPGGWMTICPTPRMTGRLLQAGRSCFLRMIRGRSGILLMKMTDGGIILTAAARSLCRI